MSDFIKPVLSSTSATETETTPALASEYTLSLVEPGMPSIMPRNG